MLAISWEVGWDCRWDMVQASHCLGTRFWGICPKREHSKDRGGSQRVGDPPLGVPQHLSHCGWLVNVITSQSTFKGRGLASPPVGRGAYKYREGKNPWGHHWRSPTAAWGCLFLLWLSVPPPTLWLCTHHMHAVSSQWNLPLCSLLGPSLLNTPRLFRSLFADCPALQMAHNKSQMQCKMMAKWKCK